MLLRARFADAAREEAFDVIGSSAVCVRSTSLGTSALMPRHIPRIEEISNVSANFGSASARSVAFFKLNPFFSRNQPDHYAPAEFTTFAEFIPAYAVG